MLFPDCLKAKCNLRLQYEFYEMKTSTLLVLLQINVYAYFSATRFFYMDSSYF